MSRTLFIGNMESPFIREVLETLIASGREIIMSADSYEMMGTFSHDNSMDKNKVQTWSWNEKEANYQIKGEIINLFPYLYPDTIAPHLLEKLSNFEQSTYKSYGSFRLGFGVQEELFDLFLAQFLEVTELAYFDNLSSLQLLNPVSQLEYRKRSYEYLRFVDKEEYMLSEQKLLSKKYKLINSIPFFENFSKKFGYPNIISHYVLDN